MLMSMLIDHNPVVGLFTNLVSKVGIVGDFASYLRSLLFNKDD